MTRNLLKKLVIGGAIFLSSTISVLGQQKQIQSEKQVLFAKRDPFVPPKNVYYLLKQEERIVTSLDELTRRLEKDGFDKKQILISYGDKRFIIHRDIINLFSKSPEAKGAKGIIIYDNYRKSLGLEDKLLRAPKFLKKHKEELTAAEIKHGVDKRYIVAILGIESDFGNNAGHYYAFNALTSLYATHLKEFAYRELKEYLVLCNKNKRNLFGYKSSYAGAIGYAQFIPSSFNSLFIDGNGDFNADPCNINDCIHSIAHYLEMSGWNAKANDKVPAENSKNWKALQRYNNSKFYVKAVIELATKTKWNASDIKVVASNIGIF
jgi:membrane-bound lytic murein transglycosylase B